MPEENEHATCRGAAEIIHLAGRWGREVGRKEGGLVSSLDPLDLLVGAVVGGAERKEGARQVGFGDPFSPG